MHQRFLSVNRGAARRGASVVEFAFVAPILLIFVLGIIEFGRAMWVQQTLANATREGGRQAILSTATKSGVQSIINSYLQSSKISGHTIVMTDPAQVAPGGNVTITVSVPYSNISLLPIDNLGWMSEKTLSATVVMRKEPSLQ
jgi:Flp pilus assembly protein TadG